MALIDSKSYIDKKLVRIRFEDSPSRTITYDPQSADYVYDISLEKAAKLNPQLEETARYWYYVGASYNMDGDQTIGEISIRFFNKAIDAFNKALEIDPNYQKALEGKDYALQQSYLFS
jgi:tetratricopeptide (TPR) repeat protein